MQRYFSNLKKDDYFVLNDDDIRHIKLVMRMKDQDEIEVVYQQKLFLCCIENVNQNVKIKIKKEISIDDKNNKNISLIIPILKESKMDLILQKSTELGVDEIIPIITERSIIRINDKESKKLDRWKRIIKEASEQSKRLNIPVIREIKQLRDLTNIDGLKVICSTMETKKNFKSFLQSNKNYDKITLAIGPEGGFSLVEEHFLNEQGFVSVSLGSRILRVETVPIALLSILNYENME